MLRAQDMKPLAMAVLVAFFLFPPGLESIYGQDQRSLDLTHLPQDAVIAAFAFPKQLASRPDLELLPREVLTAAAQQEWGFDPLEIEQAIVFAAVPQLTSPPDVGLILRFSKPPLLAEKLTRGMQPARVGETIYLRGNHPSQLCLCQVGGNRLLVAPEPLLRKMIVTQQADGPLHTMLRNASTDNDITAALAFSPLRDVARQMVQQAPPLPANLQPLLTIPDHLQSVTVQLNVTGKRASTITIQAVDADSAAKLEQVLTQAMEQAKQMLLAQAMQGMTQGHDDPIIQQAMVQYLHRMADSIEAKLKPVRTEDTLVVTTQSEWANSGMLVALLLPAVQAAREAARRTQSMNNLKQIALAMHNYHDAHNRFPARANYKDDKPLLSWRVHILPYLEQRELYERFHLDEPWDSEHNKPLVALMPAVYQNPNLPRLDGKTNYLVLSGKETIFSDQEGASLASITDGTSNTILTVEADADRAVEWTRPDDLDYDAAKPLSGLGHLRANIFLAGFADGSVRAIADSIDLVLLRALVTRSGGEAIPLPAGP